MQEFKIVRTQRECLQGGSDNACREKLRKKLKKSSTMEYQKSASSGKTLLLSSAV